MSWWMDATTVPGARPQRIREHPKPLPRPENGFACQAPLLTQRVPATRAISEMLVRPRRTFSSPSSRSRIMPSCTAAWAIVSAGSRATASERMVSETHMTS